MMPRPFLVALMLAPALAAGASPAHDVVAIRDMAFGPAPANLKVGDIIEWRNMDIFQHTATTKAGGFDLVLKPGAKAEAHLTKAGTFTVSCRYHPNMRLKLVVGKP